MTSLTLQDDTITGEEERALLLGVTYDAAEEKHLELETEIGDERQRYDDQIFAGLLCPW